jgi:hypothetical protein
VCGCRTQNQTTKPRKKVKQPPAGSAQAASDIEDYEEHIPKPRTTNMATLTANQEAQALYYNQKYSQNRREELAEFDDSCFAGSSGTYPVLDGEDVELALNLASFTGLDDPDVIRENVLSIARERGLGSGTGGVPVSNAGSFGDDPMDLRSSVSEGLRRILNARERSSFDQGTPTEAGSIQAGNGRGVRDDYPASEDHCDDDEEQWYGTEGDGGDEEHAVDLEPTPQHRHSWDDGNPVKTGQHIRAGGSRMPSRNQFQPVPVYLGQSAGVPPTLNYGGGLPVDGDYGPDLTTNCVESVAVTNCSPAIPALSANRFLEEAASRFASDEPWDWESMASAPLMNCLRRQGRMS